MTFLEVGGTGWWIIGLGLIVAGALVLQVASQLVMRRLEREVIRAFSLPWICLIWFFAITYSIDLLGERFGFDLPTLQARRLAMVAAAVWFVMRWKRGLEKRRRDAVAFQGMREDSSHLAVVARLTSLAVFGLAALVVMEVFGINVSSLVALGGFGALAVSMAGRDLFANLFGGRMLYLTKPFAEGETISAPKAGLDGRVERIGWYQTEIQGPDGRPIYVPNSIFANQAVINETRTLAPRISFTLRVKTVGPVEPLIAALNEQLRADEQLTPSYPTGAFLSAVGGATADILIQAAMTKHGEKERRSLRQQLLLASAATVTRLGHSLA